MAESDFVAALKKSVGVDDNYGLCLEKVQHDVKQGRLLMYFCSGLLPAATYLAIEEYVRKNLGEKAEVYLRYRDMEENQALFADHIRELCCELKEAAAPFVSRSLIKLKGHALHIDFADELGAEVFTSLGLKDYLSNYLPRCLGREAAVLIGRCAQSMLSAPIRPKAKKGTQKMQKADAPPTPAAPFKKTAVKKKEGALIHGRRWRASPCRSET